jgi:hypothetical protein
VVVDDDWLGVAGDGAASGAVAGVAYRDVSPEEGEVLFIEDLGDEAHTGAKVELLAIACGDACAFLSPVLKGVETVKGDAGYIVARRVNPEYSAGFARVIES